MITLLNRVKDVLNDPNRSFKQRVFILLTLVTDFMVIIAVIFDILFGESPVEIATLSVTIVIVPIITIVSISKNIVDHAAKVVVLGVVFVLLPIIFYFGGGIRGGGFVWIIFAYLYTGLVLSGRWKPAILVILTIETLVLFSNDYFIPGIINDHSEETAHIDILVSVILVGIMCYVMVWFVEWQFREENKRARLERKKLEELNKSQSRFFSSMSHEIRTPINSILGLNEIILRQEDASEEIIKDATNIQGAGKMLLSLINDILDMSKIEAGKMDIVSVNYNLGTMISEIANMMWLRAQEKGLDINIEVDPSIPAELFGDEVRVKQILVNLLNNAVKYTKEGSVTLRIEKEEIRGENILLIFSVIDTGIGIKQDVIPYLFDAFQRVDEEKNAKIEGTGLGLSIVKQLVDLMDGKITVNSVYTEGSTFMVTLRQKVTRPDAIGDINIQKLTGALSGSKYEPGFMAPDARVLIVDDNEMNLEVEKKLLDGTGMIIDTVRSGEEALAITTTMRYDIILMDHLMPEMDGIECMQHIRKQVSGLNNHVPVIVLTANADSENRELYNRSGFDGYLVKPVSGKQLEDMLIAHLPEFKVERINSSDSTTVKMNTSRGYSKKIPVLVATSSMCDLPRVILDAYQIDVIPFSILSDDKVYRDVYEASTDEVLRYMKSGIKFDSKPPSVEEFEAFFAAEIKKAHQVIYIAVGSGVSKEYSNARDAAKAYGNVRVFDSYYNSSTMGLLVLLAYKMAMQGRNMERIISELEAYRADMSCSFVTGDAEFIMKRNGIGKVSYGLVSTFGLRPIINVRHGSISLGKLCVGDLLSCYEKYIDYAIPKSVKPDTDFLLVDYVELSEEDMAALDLYIRTKYGFENIIFQRASAVMALNCGMGALGIAFLKKADQPHNLSPMLSAVLNTDDTEDVEIENTYYIANDATKPEQVNIESVDANNTDMIIEAENNSEDSDQDHEEESEAEKRPWYEEIPGLDGKTAIQYSGSEDAFRMVLKIFYDTIDSRSAEIKKYYDAEDWENYTVKVHALKSSARLVGAYELGDAAERLEMAGKRDDIDFIRKNTDKLFKDYKSYEAVLKPIFGNADKEEDNDADNDKEPIPSDDSGQIGEDEINERFDSLLLESVYEALRDGAESRDDSMIRETLEEISEYELPAGDKELLGRIEKCFQNGDYEGIISELDN